MKIYNAISLNPKHKDLLVDMIAEAISYFRKPYNRRILADIFIGKVALELMKMGALDPNTIDDEVKQKYVDMAKEINTYDLVSKKYSDYFQGKTIKEVYDTFVEDFSDEELEFYFHVHPHHSVSYLHMHIVTGGRFRTNDSHDWKNFPATELLKHFYGGDSYLDEINKRLISMAGGGKKKPSSSYKKTDIKKEVGGRMRTIYKDSKGGHYVQCKMNGKTLYKKYADAVKAAAASKKKKKAKK